VAFFKFGLSLVFNLQVFKFWFFVQQVFFLSAKFQFGFVESLKSASRFLACVSINFGFDWLCFVASALFVVGCVGFQNRLVFFLQKFWSIEFVKFGWFCWRCRFLAKSGFSKLAFWLVYGFVRQSSFLSQAFWLVVAFDYLAFWQVLFSAFAKIKVLCKTWACWWWFWFSISASCTKPANKACSGRWGFCGIFGLYLHPKRILLLEFYLAPPHRH
jgi:hypothetical protein